MSLEGTNNNLRSKLSIHPSIHPSINQSISCSHMVLAPLHQYGKYAESCLKQFFNQSMGLPSTLSNLAPSRINTSMSATASDGMRPSRTCQQTPLFYVTEFFLRRSDPSHTTNTHVHIGAISIDTDRKQLVLVTTTKIHEN